jgi:hypothetical protein
MLFDNSPHALLAYPLRREPLGDLGKNCETRVNIRVPYSRLTFARANPRSRVAQQMNGYAGRLTVQRNNANDESNAQHHDNERVDLETGALVGVKLQHSRAAATSTSGASA